MSAVEASTHNPTRAAMAAGALFVDEAGRVMLVKPTYKNFWDIPGGYVEPGESPAEACAREVREELGIEPQIGRLLVTDWAPTEKDGDKVLFVFDGGQLTAEQHSAIHVQTAELVRYEYAAISDLPRYTIDRLVRRIAAAEEARRTGLPLYLENGLVPSPS
ncbi:MAG TPA: NUDIX hydrolase [Actinocatenispora sp.]